MMLLEHRDGHVLYIRARRMATVCYGYQRAASDGTQLQTRYAGVVQTTFHTRPSTTRLHLRPATIGHSPTTILSVASTHVWT
jgi:hypothetical protein